MGRGEPRSSLRAGKGQGRQTCDYATTPIPFHPISHLLLLITTDSQGSAVLKDSWVPFYQSLCLDPAVTERSLPRRVVLPFWKHLLVTLRLPSMRFLRVSALFPPLLHSMGAIPNSPASGQPLRCLTSPGFLGSSLVQD